MHHFFPNLFMLWQLVSMAASFPTYLIPAQCINRTNLSMSQNQRRSSTGSKNGSNSTPLDEEKNIRNKNRNRKSRNKKKVKTESGFYPNIGWRVIPMDDLRLHPYFDPLPHPTEIKRLDAIQDVNQFRQDSIQWDLLHNGRCTTSRAACALGILEPKAADRLNIPHSLRKKGIRAYDHLRGRPLSSLDEMNYILCNVTPSDFGYENYDNSIELFASDEVWSINKRAELLEESAEVMTDKKGLWQRPFAAEYIRKLSLPDGRIKRRQRSGWSLLQARMAWGSIQESNAILTALNYFTAHFPGSRVKEIGMCVGEESGYAHILDESGLLVGASPDAIIEYPNGTLAVLEVKNHCPFVPVNWKKSGMSSERTKFFVGSKPPPFDVPSIYVCQLMLEMLCLGPACRSAIMVRQTATKGASIIKLERDDKWIEEMLYFLNKFKLKFVNNEIPPPQNFFWDDDVEEEMLRYQSFIDRTAAIGKGAKLMAYVPHKNIQRAVHYKENGSSVRTPLFIDDL